MYHNNTGQARHAFLIGITSDEITTSQEEHVNFSDVLQFSFQESYRNLTLKTLMGFKWVTECCSNANCIIKTDDDLMLIYMDDLHGW